MIDAANILWVKNVKHDDGAGIAYFESGQELEFNLNFSESQKSGNDVLKISDVILLFQRVDKMPGIIDRTYLTHLVTPIDSEVYYNPENLQFPYERRVAVVAKADPRSENPIFSKPDKLSFYKPNRGKVCPINLLNDNWTLEQIQAEVWNLFSTHFNENYQQNIQRFLFESNSPTIDIEGGMEGKELLLFRMHLIRERNPQLVARVKAKALIKGNGTIECECCKFNFGNTYGNFANGFIECHHRIPISTGKERLTKEGDLALVCSNCHRMLHRKNMEGKYYTVEELKNKVVKS